MATNYLICDISTAPIEGVDAFVEPGDPPVNYTKPETIAKWKEEARLELIDRAGLDVDTARITGVALLWPVSNGYETEVRLCRTEADERLALNLFLDSWLITRFRCPLVGFNSLKFDWPMLMRRALYLGIHDLTINTDRYRSSNIDVSDALTFRGTVKAKSLNWYCRRLGWADLCEKPLSGADEAKVFQTGAWAALEASLRRDVEATRRLAEWAGLIQPALVMSPEQVEVGF